MKQEIIDKMSGQPAPWLSGEGPDSFVVLSSRIRLARNISDFPFPPAADSDSREKVLNFISPAFSKIPLLENGNFFQTSEIDGLSQKFLMERHLISPEFVRGGSGRGLYIEQEEKISIMLQ